MAQIMWKDSKSKLFPHTHKAATQVSDSPRIDWLFNSLEVTKQNITVVIRLKVNRN